MNQLTLNKKWLFIFIIAMILIILSYILLNQDNIFNINVEEPVTLKLSGPILHMIETSLKEQLEQDLDMEITLVEESSDNILIHYNMGYYQSSIAPIDKVGSTITDDLDTLLSELDDQIIDTILMPYQGDFIPEFDLILNQLDSRDHPTLYMGDEYFDEFNIIMNHYLTEGYIDKWIDEYNNQFIQTHSLAYEEIKVGIPQLPPVSYVYNKRLYGISIALINKYANINNHSIVYITGEKEKLKEMLQSDELDLMISDEDFDYSFQIYNEPYVIVSQNDFNHYPSYELTTEIATYEMLYHKSNKHYKIPMSLYSFSQSHLDTEPFYFNYQTDEISSYYVIGDQTLVDSLHQFLSKISMDRLLKLSLYDIPNERKEHQSNQIILQFIVVLIIITSIYIVMRLILSRNEKSRLNYLFKHDQLTYLPNNYGLKKLFNPSLKGAMFLIDIKRFKLINDLYGYDIGDQILIELGNLLNEISNDCVVGRTSGNQFICIATEDYHHVLEAIQHSFETFKHNTFHAHKLSLSLCYVEYPKYSNSYDTLIQYLESVMYYVKKNNITDKWIAFDDDIYKHYLNEQELAIEIQMALDNEDFLLYYQPQTELYHEKTIGAEVLVRWIHEERGPIYPDQFLGVAERNGLMRKLDMYMIKNACKQIKLWQEEALEPMKISVNMSTYTFDSPGMTEELLEIISNSNIDTTWFALEITEESGLANIQQAQTIMNDIKKHGIRFALDDFGKGYSSINYLEQLPFDFLKIDKAFVDHIHTNEKSKKLYSLITDLAKLYEMHIIAEGVEYKEQIDVIKHDLDTIIQGYYYSKPLTLDDFDKRIKNR